MKKKKLFTQGMAGFCIAAMMFAGFPAVPAAAAESVTATSQQTVASDCMQKVYEILTKSGSEYNRLKEQDLSTAYSESFENNTITIAAKGEYINGTWKFQLDGNYIVSSWGEEDYMGVYFWGCVRDALAEYLGMDVDLAGGYASWVASDKMPSDYVSLTLDETAKTWTSKLYAAGAYDMSAMDSWYLDEGDLSILEPLGESSVNYLVSVAKLRFYSLGNKDSVDIYIAEHGGMTEITYRSLINALYLLQPTGYKDFLNAYTELKEVKASTWQVSFVEQSEAPEAFSSLDSHYKYLKLHIEGPEFDAGKEIWLSAGSKQTLKVVNGKAKSWSSSKKSVATVKNGKVVALKKGTTKITATLKDGTKLTCKVTVTDSPLLTIGDRAFNKNKTYSVKKGTTLTVKISGKAASVNNVYASSKKSVARVISKTSARTVKIKGLKKGTTVISIKVNGVAYKMKVKVS